MPDYLFGWNPKVWSWAEIDQDRSKIVAGASVKYHWQCSNRHMQCGDLAWVIRYGTGAIPRGIVAKGVIVREHYLDQNPAGHFTPHVDIEFGEIRFSDPDDILPTGVLQTRML